MNTRRIFPQLLLAVLACSMLARADAINQAEVFVNPNSAGGTGPFSQVVSQLGAIDISGSATGPATGGPVESGDGSAHVNYGTIKLFSSVFASATGTSFARFRDDLLFNDPALPVGTALTVDYLVSVDGLLTVDASGIGSANWLLQTALGSNLFNITKSGTLRSPELSNPGYSGDPLGQIFLAQSTVANGIAAQLDVEFTASSQAGFDTSLNPGSGTANFLNTLQWAGIQSVTANGQPVSYTLTSTSGTDWNQSLVTATPEPATPVLVAGMIACMVFFHRKRKRSERNS